MSPRKWRGELVIDGINMVPKLNIDFLGGLQGLLDGWLGLSHTTTGDGDIPAWSRPMAAEAEGRAYLCSCLVRGSRHKGCKEPGQRVYVFTLCPGCGPWSPGFPPPGLRFSGAPTS